MLSMEGVESFLLALSSSLEGLLLSLWWVFILLRGSVEGSRGSVVWPDTTRIKKREL